MWVLCDYFMREAFFVFVSLPDVEFCHIGIRATSLADLAVTEVCSENQSFTAMANPPAGQTGYRGHVRDSARFLQQRSVVRTASTADTTPSRKCEDSSGSTRCARGTDCALSGSAAESDASGIDISVRDHSTSAVAGEESRAQGSGAGRCCFEAALGSQHQGNGSASRPGEAAGQQYSMDY